MFYGEKLYRLREMFSYTRKELADQLKIDEYLLWQIETNRTVPDFMLIKSLQEYFHVQSSFFFEPAFIENKVGTGKIAYRQKKSSLRDRIELEKSFLNFFYTHIQKLEEYAYLDPGNLLFFREEIENTYNLFHLSAKDIKIIAQSAREQLNILSNQRLMYYLEVAGVYIIEKNMEQTVDAYSAWLLEKNYPVIVLNDGKNSAVRRNFDMGHELAHLLLHHYIDFDYIDKYELEKIEREANLFASYLLLPQEEFKVDFMNLKHPTNPRDYIHLKEKYRVSIQSMAYRAYSEGWLSKEENRLFWKNINRFGYKIREPLDEKLVIHIPGKIRALLLKATEINDGLITEWLDEYSVEIEYFEKIFGIKDDLLRQYVGQKRTKYLHDNNILHLND